MNGSAVIQLPVSARQPDRFTPPASAGDDPPPVYLIAVPTVMAKAMWQRRVAQAGAVYASDATLTEALRDGINAVVAAESRDAALAVLDRKAELQAEAERLLARGEEAQAEREALGLEAAEVMRQVAHIERVVSRGDERYRDMVADRGLWMTVAPVLAAKHFLAGWENAPGGVRFRRDPDGLAAMDALDALPEGHLMAIGWRAIALMNAGASAKN